MDYQQFINAVEMQIRKSTEGIIKVSVNAITKNNGKERVGITLSNPEVNISPTIYLEEYYKQFCEGVLISEIVDGILTLYQEVKFKHSFAGESVTDYETVKNRLVYKLINKKKNETLLKGIPYVPYLDLAMVFYILLELNEHGTATVLVREEHMKLWDITEETLFKLAKENTKRLLPAELKTMKTVIREMMCLEESEEEAEDYMYVLSNVSKNFGAATLLYEGMTKQIWSCLKESYYVLPSSVHEMIIIPESKCPSRAELDEMIYEINRTQVEEEEILSDRAYYYDGARECLAL